MSALGASTSACKSDLLAVILEEMSLTLCHFDFGIKAERMEAIELEDAAWETLSSLLATIDLPVNELTYVHRVRELLTDALDEDLLQVTHRWTQLLAACDHS